MASPVQLYQKEMHDNLGFFATWLPGDSIEVGDIGLLENGRFRRITSLHEIGIDVQLGVGLSKQNLHYTSSEGINITTTASAAVASVAKGEIKFDFSREGAFLFNAHGLTTQNLANRSYVASQILNVYNEKKWEKDWLLIESLHTAESITIIVSEDSSAGLTLQANANVPIPAISLDEPKIKFAVTSTRGKIVHIIGGKNLHPLYSCLRLKDPFFMAASVQPVRGSSPINNEIPLLRAGIDELLNS